MSFALAAADSATMFRRNLRHLQRYPGLTITQIGMPLVFLLLFVYVFGGTLGAGLPGGEAGGRSAYLAYVTPGILLLTVASGAPMAAISVAKDMTEGIMARFRTMAISRASVITGHVLGGIFQTLLSVAVLTGVALLLGLRPTADALGWLAAAGLLALLTVGVTWLAVALGLVAKTVESASNTPMFLMLLPFFGSSFVPTASMPTGLRWFAEYQPFTPMTETLRGLLMGTPIGDDGWIALAWAGGLSVVCYVWAKRLFAREPRR